MGRKHYGKSRNCSLRAISPFPTVFSKGLFPLGVKRCHCVGMGYDIVENACGKRRKCWLPALSPFSTVFSKAFYFKSLKKAGLCGKELMLEMNELFTKRQIFRLAQIQSICMRQKKYN